MTKTTRRYVLLLIGAMALAACGADATQTDATSTTAPDPTTSAPADATTTTTTIGVTTTMSGSEPVAYVEGADPEADAVAEAYSVAFDSSTSFEEKSAYIDDPSGLEGTIETYAQTGDSVGGVTVDVTEIAINGDTADVVYTLQFSGNPTYPGQTGTAMKSDGGWVLSRQMFCGVMASARSACP